MAYSVGPKGMKIVVFAPCVLWYTMQSTYFSSLGSGQHDEQTSNNQPRRRREEQHLQQQRRARQHISQVVHLPGGTITTTTTATLIDEAREKDNGGGVPFRRPPTERLPEQIAPGTSSTEGYINTNEHQTTLFQRHRYSIYLGCCWF